MFIAIYEFQVKSGSEDSFRESWSKLTHCIFQQNGSLGSRLHKQDEDRFVAYAQWPDRQSWESSREKGLNEEGEIARRQMWETLEAASTVYELDLVDDYLQQHICM
ncbi:MAG: antibiotic biosynthesis monooxygenase [Proteobacteria bacterium]|nr:antibiotic biosynthesis monooxygenase [Pseudomonadota bacterium]